MDAFLNAIGDIVVIVAMIAGAGLYGYGVASLCECFDKWRAGL